MAVPPVGNQDLPPIPQAQAPIVPQAPLGLGAVPNQMAPHPNAPRNPGFFEKCVLQFKKLLLYCIRLNFEFWDWLREISMPLIQQAPVPSQPHEVEPHPVQPQQEPAPQPAPAPLQPQVVEPPVQPQQEPVPQPPPVLLEPQVAPPPPVQQQPPQAPVVVNVNQPPVAQQPLQWQPPLQPPQAVVPVMMPWHQFYPWQFPQPQPFPLQPTQAVASPPVTHEQPRTKTSKHKEELQEEMLDSGSNRRKSNALKELENTVNEFRGKVIPDSPSHRKKGSDTLKTLQKAMFDPNEELPVDLVERFRNEVSPSLRKKVGNEYLNLSPVREGQKFSPLPDKKKKPRRSLQNVFDPPQNKMTL